MGEGDIFGLQSKRFRNIRFRGSANNFFLKKYENTMEVGGWVQASLGIFLLENRPKIALNQ